MNEYKIIFANNLQSELKRKIKGKVFVTVTKTDGIYVQLTNEMDNIQFKTYVENLSDKLHNGYSVNYAGYEIIKQYKEYIRKVVEERYFYND